MSAYPDQTDPGWRRRLRSRVLRWYAEHGRTLPWRESADPYRIWISEIMLQQTTVAAVVPYFERFLDRFPDVHALAAADVEEVLRLWEGLGYYSRARNLHKAAGVIVTEHAGEFPADRDALQTLPGVGPYTAGAIASFAFNLPAGILEANTIRLYSRLIALDIDPRGSRGQKTLWSFADWVVARKRAGDFNQAVMDLGSQVCTPADPPCPRCPLMASCKAYELGRQEEIPLEKKKVAPTDVVEVSVAISKGGQFLLRQRQENERWAGLWDFVRFEIEPADEQQIESPPRSRVRASGLRGQRDLFDRDELVARPVLPSRVASAIGERTGLLVDQYRPMKEIRHAVTRYRIRLLCMVCESPAGRIKRGSGYRWCSATELQTLPLSTTGRQFADLLTQAD